MRDDERQIASTAAAPGDGRPGPVYAFAERLVVAALRNGLEHFHDEPRHWDWMLGFLDERERQTVRALFRERPPTIRYGYARDTDPWPIVGVVLASEEVAQSGEFLANILEVGDGQIVEGEIHEQRIDVTVYADHPDVALYTYHWAKYCLFAHVDWLQRWVINPHFVMGGEIAPDPRYLPEHCYLRRMQWSMAGEASAPLPMPEPPRNLYVMPEGLAHDGRKGRMRATRPAAEE